MYEYDTLSMLKLGEQMTQMLLSTAVACATVAAVAAAVMVWQKFHKHSHCDQALVLLYEFRHACATPLYVLRHISEHVALEMQAGLNQPGGSQLMMLPTFIEKLPNGCEKGLFYALDLSGTNFRVLRCLLGGPNARVIKQEYEVVAIPRALLLGTSEELFDFIAQRLISFIKLEGPEFQRGHNWNGHQIRELGLTISFPICQTSHNTGILIKWTEGFKIADGVGKDVVAMLQSAMDRQKGFQIRVAVLINDTVGTMAGGHYWNDDVMVGVILGTNTNACYVECNLPEDIQTKSGKMVIYMEWGRFWSSHLPRTYIDEQLDNESVNPGDRGFEKMTGAMYLGEIVRRVLARMAQEANLFGDSVPTKLKQPFILLTLEMSKMHADESPDLRIVDKVLKDVFDIKRTELSERRIVHSVCDTVTMRAARLAAAFIVGILKKIGRDGWDATGVSSRLMALPRDSEHRARLELKRTVVAMDGILYEHYHRFRIYMQAAVYELLSEAAARKLVIELSKDGSGTGASILAACHSEFAPSYS
ncbi:hexokinase-1 isoform X8 [Physcomitrium patens]